MNWPLYLPRREVDPSQCQPAEQPVPALAEETVSMDLDEEERVLWTCAQPAPHRLLTQYRQFLP